jgi:hypothetical protein
MDFNIKEIAKAWYNSLNPTENQRVLSEKRLNVCMDCPSQSKILKGAKWSYICKECGCPIGKKSFSEVYNPCPLQKWESVDSEYFNTKKKKTVI